MAASACALDRYPLIRTQNAEEMCAAFERIYAKPALCLAAQTKRVDVAVNHYQAKDLAIAYTKYGADITAVYPENIFTLQTFPVRGRGEVTINKVSHPLDSRHGIVVSPDTNFAIKLNAHYEHFVLVINTRALTGKLSALTGATIRDPLRFDPVRDDRRPAANALRTHFFFLIDTLSTCEAPLQKAVLAEFEQALMVMFLHANPHNYSHLLERDVLDAAPRQVRQAEEYMEANAWRAIALEELSEVTGVSALSLFQAFRRTRGYSPSRFLARLRSPLGST